MIQPISKQWYGWIPDAPDFRDAYLAGPTVKPAKETDLETIFHVPMVSQKDAGACVGHGTERCARFARFKNGLLDWPGSRLYTYYNARRLEGETAVDNGAQIRDGIKGIVKWGISHEILWPYDTAKVTLEPTARAYKDGELNQAIRYQRVPQTPDSIRGVLTAGWPIIFGQTLYESFESDAVTRTGIVPVPASNESVVGRHCMVLWGHQTSTELYKVANSWWDEDDNADPMWGDRGFCFMPFELIHNPDITCDLWAITGVEDSLEPKRTFWTWFGKLFGR